MNLIFLKLNYIIKKVFENISDIKLKSHPILVIQLPKSSHSRNFDHLNSTMIYFL